MSVQVRKVLPGKALRAGEQTAAVMGFCVQMEVEDARVSEECWAKQPV